MCKVHPFSRVAATLTSLAGFAAIVLVACTQDESSARDPFAEPDASSDAGDASEAPPDAGSKGDAGDPRPPFDPADEPVVCADAGPCAKQLVAGANHFCALMSDGTVRCWGDDEYGALGGGEAPKDAPEGDGASPVHVVAEVTGATQISAARATTCVRLGDGEVRCWGSNSQGQLGLDDVEPKWDEFPHPTAAGVALRAPALRVDVGPRAVCAALTSGQVTCWGTNEEAQLAREPYAYVLGPAPAELGALTVARVAIGSATGLALTTGGDVWSWGAVAGREGLLGGRISSISPDRLPNRLAKLTGVTSLAVTDTLDEGEAGPLGIGPGPFPPPARKRHGHACALANGDVYCWGRSDVGALCTGLPDDEPLPAYVPVKGLAWPQQLAVGDEITCARMSNGTVQCCGANAAGRLGAGQVEPFSANLKTVTSFTDHAVQVATSHRAVCALVKDGSVQCWGSNAHGELGAAPDEAAHPSPVKIAL